MITYICAWCQHKIAKSCEKIAFFCYIPRSCAPCTYSLAALRRSTISSLEKPTQAGSISAPESIKLRERRVRYQFTQLQYHLTFPDVLYNILLLIGSTIKMKPPAIHLTNVLEASDSIIPNSFSTIDLKTHEIPLNGIFISPTMLPIFHKWFPCQS